MKLPNTSVLVVDDDTSMLRMVERLMILQGFKVCTAETGEAALELLEQDRPDIVLLDVMLPDSDGNALCMHIRETSDIPVILITAKNSQNDKIDGLESGADDYITKPFSSGELVARIKAVLRRTKLPGNSDHMFRFGNVVIDFSRNMVTLGSQLVYLTAIEYQILSYLAQNAGHVLTAPMILEKVWGDAYEGETHLLHVNMARLRKKLGDTGKPRLILTKPGIGYMVPQEAQPGSGASSTKHTGRADYARARAPQAFGQLSLQIPELLPCAASCPAAAAWQGSPPCGAALQIAQPCVNNAHSTTTCVIARES